LVFEYTYFILNVCFTLTNIDISDIGLYPRVVVTYKVFNKDGSLALSDNDKQTLKDRAKKN